MRVRHCNLRAEVAGAGCRDGGIFGNGTGYDVSGCVLYFFNDGEIRIVLGIVLDRNLRCDFRHRMLCRQFVHCGG